MNTDTNIILKVENLVKYYGSGDNVVESCGSHKSEGGAGKI